MVEQISRESGEMARQAVRGERGNKDVQAFAKHIRESLGINEGQGQLYVFVSMSMGENMLRAYLQEGAWAGAHVLVRGIPPGMTLMQYLKDVMLPLAQGQSGAGIQIDPRLFDLYSVDVVPTIVWQPGPQAPCHVDEGATRTDATGEPRQVPACDPTDQEHWQVEGSVTVAWALREFARKGAAGAQKRLAILQKNVDKPIDQDQQPFEGDWSKAHMPGDDYNPILPKKNPVADYTKGLLEVPLHASPGEFEQ